MKVGIPKGLLYCKYNVFLNSFFQELGAEIITSENTNKIILNNGVKLSVDEACLPVKIFHGHVQSIKDKCDIMILPRIMQIEKDKYICPKFCGLPEMVINNINNMPKCITYPIYYHSKSKLKLWCLKAGLNVTKNIPKIFRAFDIALKKQSHYSIVINNLHENLNIALIGHPYNIYDDYVNMNLVDLLKKMNIGIVTEEFVSEEDKHKYVSQLFKKPFWSFAKNSYGAAAYLAENQKVNGIIYVSSFGCGIDSIVIDFIKNKLKDFPVLVLKIDEQTGQAGFHTRIEAFIDMLERTCS